MLSSRFELWKGEGMDPLNAYLFTQPLYVPDTCYMLHLNYVSSLMIGLYS